MIFDRPESQEQRISFSVDLIKAWRWFKKRGTDDNRNTNSDVVVVDSGLSDIDSDVHVKREDCLGGCGGGSCGCGKDVSRTGNGISEI